ncbi:hypothetical protein RYZ26_16300 [Terasakiella sp. A23]|uniref:hypothetical protein n=1 Tax=Terasakiella sp. FCG-A23 TaxID=3080561 RepID=UPI002954DC0E|nr:hypothetical protein [Terasakiella sp. A23]MDV7341170.1 hypothetical protein [Terasakiella sp. A23]
MLKQLVFLGCFLVSLPALATEKITWLIWDLPPEFVRTGPLQNQGYADKFLQHFMEWLPDYDHHIQYVNVPRWSTEIFKPQRCSAHLWGGFFPDKLLLSKGYTFTPPHVLIFPKRHQRRIGVPGTPQSIEELLKQEDLKLATMRLIFNNDAGQSRYPVLYPYLKPYLNKENLVQQSGGRNHIDLRLLLHGRVDYTIGYPTTITNQRRSDGLGDDYISYPIIEHDIYKKVYVACENDAFGQKIIERINQHFTEEALIQFLKYHEEWNGGNIPFRTTYMDYFIHKKDVPNVID